MYKGSSAMQNPNRSLKNVNFPTREVNLLHKTYTNLLRAKSHGKKLANYNLSVYSLLEQNTWHFSHYLCRYWQFCQHIYRSKSKFLMFFFFFNMLYIYRSDYPYTNPPLTFAWVTALYVPMCLLLCVFCRTWWCLWVILWTGWSQTYPRTSVSRCTRRKSSWWSCLWRRSRAKGLQHRTPSNWTTATPPHQPTRVFHSHAHGPICRQTVVKLLAARV